ncbi:Lysophospholipase, alpha-beta hydrolase superfamily [Ruminococcus sp. YE71]|uniref:alpha/beta fold hydrolase n=1 Tax=unclassified Ruminococcus TaxID=2608920 RepID=UPI00087E9D29|nr:MULTISPECIES: alpha/beta hydrolase [unclassified Ruminococcus]SDA29831.1 Lysophospholipase, alpha-beta hydrolase superfamily [Ruminococcus sp. YE78]SFW48927.1 Lysophospholipase, alpha-beta hydrolase superfamily [Ruminococcus sp. YE71]
MYRITELSETRYIHISGSDGLPLSVLRIEPEDPARIRGIVQIVHGKNEHKGRYAAFMRYLAARGYIAVANDHRGHGESVLSSDDLGYFYKGGAHALVEDLHEITLEVKDYAEKKCGKKLPVTMLGHSMGSLAARCYIRRFDADIDKLVILGCPSKSNMVRQGIMMVKLLELAEGKRARSRFAKLLIMGVSYEFRFRKEGLRNSWTNTDFDAVVEHNNDPLCRYNFTLAGYEEMLKLARLTYTGGFRPDNPDMPIRFFSGADDPCALSRKKIVQAIHFLQRNGYRNVRGKLYEGMRHDILHEKQKVRVYRDILKFIGS